MTLDFRKLSNQVGMEVLGLDVSKPISAEQGALLRRTLAENNILLFRNCELSLQDQLNLTQVFGTPEPNDSVAHLRHPENEGVIIITNKRADGSKSRTGQMWHSDHSFALHPTMASLLYARQLPAVGGDTVFANMYTPLENFSAGFRDMLRNMWAVHDLLYSFVQLYGMPDEARVKRIAEHDPPVAQPVVLRHPETGREALYVSELVTTAFVGMTKAESKPLLQQLFQASVSHESSYRHQWKKNDLIIWDNRCTMHLALTDYDQSQTRTLYRTAVLGEQTGRPLTAAEREVYATE